MFFIFKKGGCKIIAICLLALGFTFMGNAQAAATFYTAEATNTVLTTMGLSTSTLGSTAISNPSLLAPGTNNYNYAAVVFRPLTSGSMFLGQTLANTDTVMMLYSGIFDPLNPGAGGLTGNDDTSAASHISAIGQTVAINCGSGGGADGFCPQVVYNVVAGNTYTLVVSTYNAGRSLSFPFKFYGACAEICV